MLWLVGRCTSSLPLQATDRCGLLEQFWHMGLARNWAEWEAAMRSQQLPIFNTCYADQDGHIAYIYNAALPVHPEGDYEFWKGVVPGDRSDLIATEIQPWEAVPKTIGRCLSSLFISRIFFDS